MITPFFTTEAVNLAVYLAYLGYSLNILPPTYDKLNLREV